MGTSISNEIELIRLTVIDYFTSDILIDSLVWPDVKMQSLNTRFSGVTWGQLNNARRSGECILGRDRARKAVYRFVGPETVVVAHGGDNDFNSLRWIHGLVVDTRLIDFIPAMKKRREEFEKLKLQKEKQKNEDLEKEKYYKEVGTKTAQSQEIERSTYSFIISQKVHSD
jgi:RNA exonuclease 1